MKTKSFVVLALSILALTLFISSISALSLTPSALTTFTQVGSSQTVTITSAGNGNTSLIFPTTLNGPNGAVFSVVSTNTSITNTTSLKITLTSIQNYGGSLTILQINGTDSGPPANANASTSITLNYIKSFCTIGDVNDTSYVDSSGISVTYTNDRTGTSSTTWNPLDTIEVKVKLANNNQTSALNNVVFEVGLINTATNRNIIGDMQWISADNQKVTIGSISAGDTSDTYIFKFKIDPSTIANQNNQQNYLLMVKAYPQNKDNQICIDYSSDFSDNFGNSNIGSAYAEDIVISTPQNSKAIVIDSNSLPIASQVLCGQQLTLTPSIFNIGSNDNTYSKSQMLVVFSSPQLGISQNETLYGDLNSGSNVQAPFTINIPLTADVKSYPAYMNVYYGYSQGNGGYFNDYKYISENFNTIVQVTGGCVYATPDTTGVTAQLVAGGKAGNPLTISSTITNTGNRTVSYNFGLESYSSWATLSSISPINITLAPEQSQDITLNLNINPSAVGGNQIFYLDVYSNGYLITKQPISVPVTSGFSFSSITGNAVSGSNWLIWTFGLLIVVLVILIIIVLVRLRRR